MLGTFLEMTISVISLMSPFIEVDGKKKLSVFKLLTMVIVISVLVTAGKRIYLSTGDIPNDLLPTETSMTGASTGVLTPTAISAAVETETSNKKVAPGMVLTIGTYEGKSIDWRVLDVQGHKALLLSTKAIESIKYHTEDGTVTWGESYLRDWLNGVFLITAFSEDEQAAILTTVVDNSTDQGNPGWRNPGCGNTKDKIFLLSYAEFKHYVEGTDFSVCEAAYYTKPGEDERVKLLDNGTEAAFWWLRSPGINGKQAAFINFEGKCFSNYATNWYLSARPAMWVDINKIDELEN